MRGNIGPRLLIDTYSLFFRAFHALPEMNTSRGEPTSALYGFSAVLLKELRERAPSGIAFAVDTPQETFRHERYPEYKAQRSPLPRALVVQLERLEQLFTAFQAPVFSVPGFEADDVLATLSHRLRGAGQQAIVLSGDRDLLQLAHGSVAVLFMGARGQKPLLYDEGRVRERFGVGPEKLPDWAALVGDSSDNWPGLPGVGPRTATKWLQRFGNLHELLEQDETALSARWFRVLQTGREQLLRNLELATLRSDVPIPDGPLSAPFGESARAGLRALFSELEFKSLLARLDTLAIDVA